MWYMFAWQKRSECPRRKMCKVYHATMRCLRLSVCRMQVASREGGERVVVDESGGEVEGVRWLS